MFLNEFNKEEQSAFYALANKIVVADEVVDTSEKILLSQFLQEMGVTKKEIDIMTPGAAVEIFQLSSESIRRKAYIELYALSLCDEVLDDKEKDILDELASAFELSNDLVDKLNKCVVELIQLYKEIGDLTSAETMKG